MSKKNYSRDASMALHMDAGKARDGSRRELFVLVDPGANVVDVVEGDASALEKAGYGGIPTMGPIDVRPGVHREMVRLKKQGNPEVQQRKGGRWESRPLSATIEERTDVAAMKNRLLKGGRR